jgi:hypothetical protein
MSEYGPKTTPDGWEFEPWVGYSLAKHDLRKIWPNRHSTYAPWVRPACRELLASLRRRWPKGTPHPDTARKG